MKTNIGLLEHAISKLGMHYMFGYTGIVTEEAIQRKAKQYPSVYDADYIRKCRLLIGLWATDCSGLVDGYTDVDWSASGYYNNANKKGAIGTLPKNIPGILVFKLNSHGEIGHVGICYGDGTVIEAKGIDYGVVRTVIAGNGWDLWAFCNLISYDGLEDVMLILKKGSEGDLVEDLQKNLNTLINAGLTVDGKFGDNTYNAVRKFQEIYKLKVDGEVGDQTRSMINELLKPTTSVPSVNYEAVVAAANQQIDDLEAQLAARDALYSELLSKHNELTGALAVVKRY